jgi:chromosome segregation ATPase
MSETYDRAFFDRNLPGMSASATALAPLIIDLYAPRSIVDVGCGQGAWLRAFQDAGVSDLLGLDGPWVDPERFLVDPSAFHATDLTQPQKIDRRYDLALCLEVAEHIDEDGADVFLDTLTGLSEVIVFSAAAPGQGGDDHVNEQWPTYWAERFAVRGYTMIDNLRWAVWEDERIESWYRQNLLSVVKTSRVQAVRKRSKALLKDLRDTQPASVIHPGVHLFHLDNLARLQRARRLTPGQAELTLKISRLSDELDEFRRTKTEWWEPEIERLTEELRSEQARRDTTPNGAGAAELRAALAQREAQLAELEKSKAEWWEPELARLQAALEASAAEVRKAVEDAAAVERTRVEWYEPELQRLTDAIEGLEAELARAVADSAALERTRLEWWEPRLQTLSEELETRTAEAEGANDLRRQLGKLTQRLADVEAMEADYFYPEIERLTEALSSLLPREMEEALRAELDAAQTDMERERARAEELSKVAERLEAARSVLDESLRAALAREGTAQSALEEAEARARSLAQQARRTLVDFNDQLAATRAQVDKARAERDEVQALIETWFRPETARLYLEADQSSEREAALKAEHEALTTRLAELEEVKANYFEPEIKRLNAEAEEGVRFEREAAAALAELSLTRVQLADALSTQETLNEALASAETRHRAAVMNARRALVDHTDQLQRHGRSMGDLRRSFEEQRELIDTWFRPETERLYRDIAEADQRRLSADESAIQLKNEKVGVEQRLHAANMALDQSEREVERLRRDVAEADRRGARMEEYADRVRAEKSDVEQRLQVTSSDLDGAQHQLLEMRREVSELRQALDAVNRSRSYRLVHWYRGLYRAPLVGPAATKARRSLGRALRKDTPRLAAPE